MEVSNRVLAGLAAIAVVGGIAWFLDLSPSMRQVQVRLLERQERPTEVALRDSASRLGRLVRTEELWRQADSALSSTPAEVVVIGSGAAAAAAGAESLLTLLPTVPLPMVPRRVAIVERPAGWRRPLGLPAAFARLPAEGSAEPCTTVRVVVPGDSVVLDWEVNEFRETPWDGALGPCWYLARFGPPGPQVRRWLDARYWNVAAGIPPVRSVRGILDPRAGTWFERIVLGGLERMSLETDLGKGCVFREPEQCEEALLRAPFPAGLMPAGMVGNVRHWSVSSAATRPWLLDTPTWSVRSLLALMLQELGPERFQSFWRSEAPVREAFLKVAGVPLGEWYSAQVRRQLQEAGYPVPRGGPVWYAVLGVLALVLLASMWQAQRRQVR